MSRFFSSLSALVALFLKTSLLVAQMDTVLFEPLSAYPYPAPFSAYTARFDRLNRPYLYTANKENGVILFDYSNPLELKPVRAFTVQQFQNLKPTDLVQQGNYLYVSLGDFGGFSTQSAGLAVIDIGDPAHAAILGQWSDATFNKGSAAVRVEGDYAYLGAMEKGVILLNIAQPGNPQYVSHVVPDLNWPVPPGIFSVPHARGFALRDNEAWVCFDAGGLRLIDVSDKQHPVESAKYLNTNLDAAAQPAYNTAVIAGNYLFASVDYCGLDVVNVSNPAHPHNAAWVNPWLCSNTNWDGSPGHTNQVATACHDSLLFLSGGDTEVLAYSIADPEHPRQAGQYARLQDSLVTWGLDVNDSLVVLAQVWDPLNSPYIAKKGGISLLRWACPAVSANQEAGAPAFFVRVAPNPVKAVAIIRYFLPAAAKIRWVVSDALGRVMLSNPATEETPAGFNTTELDMANWPAGIYYFSFWANGLTRGQVFIKK